MSFGRDGPLFTIRRRVAPVSILFSFAQSTTRQHVNLGAVDHARHPWLYTRQPLAL